MLATCWICGWAAALAFRLDTALVLVGFSALLLSAQPFREGKCLWKVPLLFAFGGGSLAAVVLRHPGYESQLLFIALPVVLYLPVVVLHVERHIASRVLATAAITAVAPLTYWATTGVLDAAAWILWAALASYFALAALFVVARLRNSTACLWISRIGALMAVVGAAWCSSQRGAHWILSLAFALLAVRVWTYRQQPGTGPPVRRIGRMELLHSALSSLLVLTSLWLR